MNLFKLQEMSFLLKQQVPLSCLPCQYKRICQSDTGCKKAGINVTAEVTPHHLLLSEDDIPGVDTNYKMNPPLRSKEDQEALIEGLIRWND